ncbi:MAG: hypothetical protein R3F43_32000 [bacterium]
MSRKPSIQALLLTALTGCSYGVLPATGDEAGAPAPPASKPPPTGEPASPPQAPPPPPRVAEDGCPGIDPQGQCRGSTAIWCEGGEIRSVDCATISRPCEWVDDDTGFYCGEPEGQAPGDFGPIEGDPGDPPAEGDPGAPPPPAPGPGEGAPPPDEGAPPAAPAPDEEEDPGAPPPPPGEGAPPPPAPPPAEGAPTPPDEGAPAPPANQGGQPADPCAGVTYQGYCDGDVAVWCDGQQLRRDDCAPQGLTCGFIDEQTGYYCREPDAGAPAPPVPEPPAGAPAPDDGAPDPDAQPPADGGCGQIDYAGVCEADVVVYCNNGTLVRHDCGPAGATCGWVNDDIGNWCVER